MQSKAGTWQSEQRQKVNMMGDSTNQMSVLFILLCPCECDLLSAVFAGAMWRLFGPARQIRGR